MVGMKEREFLEAHTMAPLWVVYCLDDLASSHYASQIHNIYPAQSLR